MKQDPRVYGKVTGHLLSGCTVRVSEESEEHLTKADT